MNKFKAYLLKSPILAIGLFLFVGLTLIEIGVRLLSAEDTFLVALGLVVFFLIVVLVKFYYNLMELWIKDNSKKDES